MALCKVTIHSSISIPFTAATTAVRKTMEWDFFRAHKFCQEVHETGSSVLCIADEDKAEKYAEELESHSLQTTCVPI